MNHMVSEGEKCCKKQSRLMMGMTVKQIGTGLARKGSKWTFYMRWKMVSFSGPKTLGAQGGMSPVSVSRDLEAAHGDQ